MPSLAPFTRHYFGHGTPKFGPAGRSFVARQTSVYTTKKWGAVPEIISPRAKIQECRAQNVCRVTSANSSTCRKKSLSNERNVIGADWLSEASKWVEHSTN